MLNIATLGKIEKATVQWGSQYFAIITSQTKLFSD